MTRYKLTALCCVAIPALTLIGCAGQSVSNHTVAMPSSIEPGPSSIYDRPSSPTGPEQLPRHLLAVLVRERPAPAWSSGTASSRPPLTPTTRNP